MPKNVGPASKHIDWGQEETGTLNVDDGELQRWIGKSYLTEDTVLDKEER